MNHAVSEIKSSWVPANSLINSADFVTMDAVVPTYDTSNSAQWIPNGQKTIKLALVGIHIVGSVSGHPEMVWATFEHRSNTPDSAYQYLNANNQLVSVPADSCKWLFSSAAGAPYNVSHMSVGKTSDTITAKTGYTISASNTLREAPFGVAYNGVPNQQDSSAAASNFELIGVNNSIINQIPGNDRRKKYLFIGATWTFGGTAPNGKVFPVDTTAGSAIGTSVLANSTMETYFQSTTHSCFFCHSNHKSLLPEALSHIFRNIHPLIPSPKP